MGKWNQPEVSGLDTVLSVSVLVVLKAALGARDSVGDSYGSCMINNDGVWMTKYLGALTSSHYCKPPYRRILCAQSDNEPEKEN